MVEVRPELWVECLIGLKEATTVSSGAGEGRRNSGVAIP